LSKLIFLKNVTKNVPFATLAKMYGRLFRDTLGNVDVSTQASYTHIGRIRLNGESTLTAEAIGKKKITFYVCKN